MFNEILRGIPSLRRPVERLLGQPSGAHGLSADLLEKSLIGYFRHEGWKIHGWRQLSNKPSSPDSAKFMDRAVVGSIKSLDAYFELTSHRPCFVEIIEAMGPYESKLFAVNDVICTATWGDFRIDDVRALFRLDDFRAFFFGIG